MHARIFSDESCYYIEDLRSKSGTSINGTRIYERIKLNEGDIITVGSNSLAFTQERIHTPSVIHFYKQKAKAIADSNGIAAPTTTEEATNKLQKAPLPNVRSTANVGALRARAAPAPPPLRPATTTSAVRITGHITGPMPARRTGALSTTTSHLTANPGGMSSVTNAILRNRYYQYGETPPKAKELNTIWFILAIVLACICFALGGLLVYLANLEYLEDIEPN